MRAFTHGDQARFCPKSANSVPVGCETIHRVMEPADGGHGCFIGAPSCIGSGD